MLNQSSGISRLFEDALDLQPMLAAVAPNRNSIELNKSGYGSPTDSMLSMGRLRADAADPIETRFFDTAMEYRDDFTLFKPPEAPSQFPAKLMGSQEYASGLFLYWFVEQRWNRNTNQWVTLVGGRTSVYAGNNFGMPAYNSLEITGVTPTDNPAVTAGLVVEMHEVKLPGLKFYWFQEGKTDVIGTITVVTGAVNATYSVAIGTATITNVTPANRLFSVNDIDYAPATVGDRCIVLSISPNVVWIYEEVLTDPC
jgi:hypothetical protein